LINSFAPAPSNAADDDRPHIPRVRPDGPRIAAAIQEATERSPTFRRPIETLDDTDGLVYVGEAKCPRGVQACLVLSMKVAGESAPADSGRSRKAACDLMGSIGHELQHAAEVLADPSITDNRKLFFFFHRQGPGGEDGRFETSAAIQAGIDIRAELRRAETASSVGLDVVNRTS
jgi:hypothetical protein